MAWLRNVVGSGFSLEYARVLERGTRSGMRHFHVLVRGQKVPHIVLVGLAHLFGFGQVGHVGDVYSEGGGWYVAKYLGKSGGEEGRRKVSFSRRYCVKQLVDLGGGWRIGRSPNYLSELEVNNSQLERMVFRKHWEYSKGTWEAWLKNKAFGSSNFQEWRVVDASS